MGQRKNEGVVIEFFDDVPFPEFNWLVYRRLYVLEQWLRRIAFAAAMAKAGSSFFGVLPDGLAATLKQQQALLRRRKHLGTQNADDALWLSNFEQLRDLLTSDAIYPTVKKLTGFERALLDGKIDEIREIRNVVAHNRAVSRETLTILDAHAMALSHGLEEFKRRMFAYEKDTIRSPGESEGSAIPALFHSRLRDLHPDLSDVLAFAESDLFNFALIVPPDYRVGSFDSAEEWLGTWVDLKHLLAEFADLRSHLLAITVAERGSSFSVVWPRIESFEVHQAVVERFFASYDAYWADTEYAHQDERVVCDPKVWFHSVW